MQYWFNVARGRVEDDTDKSKGEQLLGPYGSADEAEHALAHARENTQKWDQENRRYAEEGFED